MVRGYTAPCEHPARLANHFRREIESVHIDGARHLTKKRRRAAACVEQRRRTRPTDEPLENPCVYGWVSGWRLIVVIEVGAAPRGIASTYRRFWRARR